MRDRCLLASKIGKILYRSMVVAILFIAHVQMIIAIFMVRGGTYTILNLSDS